jgi:hypothetical protein
MESTQPVLENDVAIEKVEEIEMSRCEKCKAYTGDQDFQQKVSVYSGFLLELYRVVMGSFLTLFVPQTCNDHNCGLTENVGGTDKLFNAGFGLNVVTFCAFFSMYCVEIRREGMMIDYLHINPELPTDNDGVGEALTRLPLEKKQRILSLDWYYQRTGYFAMFCFVANTIVSGFSVYKHYTDNKTTTVFVTNLLFMASKLMETYEIANTDTNVFYSAYLMKRDQFNDVDPDKIREDDVLLDDHPDMESNNIMDE